jgi:hypothetical protein
MLHYSTLLIHLEWKNGRYYELHNEDMQRKRYHSINVLDFENVLE